MTTAPGEKGKKSKGRLFLGFLAHQLIATLGVMIAAPFLLALIAPVLRIFGIVLSTNEFYHIVTGMHYFPVQAGFALILGWILAHYLDHRPMVWVWLLPAVLLLLLIVTNHHVLDLGPVSQGTPSRLSHFFGSGCRPENHCFDQMFSTLPFYSACAYSLGAILTLK